MNHLGNQQIKVLYVAVFSLVLFVALWASLFYDPVIAGAPDPRILGKHVGSWWDEDSYFEYMTTAFAFFAACAWVWAVHRARSQRILVRRRDYILPVSFIILMVVLAGEEISWGQRLLGIATPEYIQKINTQQEINLHNLECPVNIQILLYLGTIAWGGVFPFLRLLSRSVGRLFWVTRFPVPPIYCATLFFVAPLFRVVFIGDYGNYAREGMEVIMGIAFFVAALAVAWEPEKSWQCPDAHKDGRFVLGYAVGKSPAVRGAYRSRLVDSR